MIHPRIKSENYEELTEKRFWSRVNKTESCWIWTGSKDTSGYGLFRYRGKLTKAHRFVYHRLKENLEGKLTIDHLCRNRTCVNPEHLEQVSIQENIRRGEVGTVNRNKTHCKNGHLLTLENIYYRPTGGRSCKPCMRKRNRKWWKKHYRDRTSS